jgi:hypothetical protein
MGRSDLTAHGFPSSFHDRAAERTTFPAEISPMAHAHMIGDKVEAAYRRGHLLQIAEAWAKFCGTSSSVGRVVPSPRDSGMSGAIRITKQAVRC